MSSAKSTILVIEDDASIRRGVRDILRFAGHEAIEAGDYRTGLQAALQRNYDLLLLDLVLPGGSGLDILNQLRQSRPLQAVIILSARGDESDRVEGLKMGADDYVVKPFGVDELLARIAAVLRRSTTRPLDVHRLTVPGGQVDFARRQILLEGEPAVELTDKEVLLLRYLAQHRQRAISRDELLANVWGIDARGTSTRTVDMTVARLREKLRDRLDPPNVLVTVRGQGYMLGSECALEGSTSASEVRP
ncbi:MAG: response regulator transcription factor [Pirellulales bacterium]